MWKNDSAVICISVYLPDGHPADGGIQDAGVGVGAHFGHEAEPLSPADTVLLNLLPAERRQKQPEINPGLPVNHLPKGVLKHFPLTLKILI